MRYVLLIYGEESTSTPSPAELEAEMAEWWKYDSDLKASGVHQSGAALQPTPTATTVRVKSGERVVTDGPFAETREVLGGYYLIDVPDLDTAIDWAARCPAPYFMEIRPIMEFDESGQPVS